MKIAVIFMSIKVNSSNKITITVGFDLPRLRSAQVAQPSEWSRVERTPALKQATGSISQRS
ncbi:hypothetical protein [Nostoc sp.]|uniref:hypothetical protein n=1 Tax=Nostoc sp. TaxID=1180 RepID=UPI002FFBF5C7